MTEAKVATSTRLDAVRAAAGRFIYNSLYRSGTGTGKLEVIEPLVSDAAPESPSRDSEVEMKAALGVGVAMRDALNQAGQHTTAQKAERATVIMRDEIMRGGTIVGRCAEMLTGPTKSLSPLERRGRQADIQRVISVDSESVLRAEAVAEARRGRGPTQRGPSAPALMPGTVIEVERPNRVDAKTEIDRAKAETDNSGDPEVDPKAVKPEKPAADEPKADDSKPDPKAKPQKGQPKADDVVNPRG